MHPGASGGHAAAAVVLAQAVGGSSAAGGRGAPGVAGVAKPPEGGVGMAVPSVQPPQASAATAVNAPPPPRTGGGASKHRAGQPFQSEPVRLRCLTNVTPPSPCRVRGDRRP